MGIAASQEIPQKPEEKSEWTFRRLFPFGGAVTSISKVFINPFDVLLGYLVFILGIAELSGRKVSWMMWVFAVFILLSALLERHKAEISKPKEEVKKDKK